MCIVSSALRSKIFRLRPVPITHVGHPLAGGEGTIRSRLCRLERMRPLAAGQRRAAVARLRCSERRGRATEAVDAGAALSVAAGELIDAGAWRAGAIQRTF
jgi:hypothetical protein